MPSQLINLRKIRVSSGLAGKTISHRDYGGTVLAFLIGFILLLSQPVFGQSKTLSPDFSTVSGTEASVKTPVDLPPLQLLAREIKGEVLYQPPADSDWIKLKQDHSLKTGSYIRTNQAETVGLQVPGLSYLQLAPGSEIVINRLDRKTNPSDPVFRDKQKISNIVDLELIEGEISAAVAEREDVENNFQVKTKTAIAGVQGTTFHCKTNLAGKTSLGVHRGTATLENRYKPATQITLHRGERSQIKATDTRPEPPEALDQKSKWKLTQFDRKAEKLLQLPPTIYNLELEHEAFTRQTPYNFQITYPYTKRKELTLGGQARPRAKETKLKQLTVQLNGEEQQVEGLADWETTFSPAPPERGEQKIIPGKITAVDGRQTTSLPVRFRIILKFPEPHGALPQNLTAGTVPAQPRQIGQTSFEQIEFPVEITNQDLARYPWGNSDTRLIDPYSGLTVSGLVETDSKVAGVAYSLDEGRTWSSATGKRYWSFELEEDLLRANKELQVQVVAWTESGKVGQAKEIGPITYSEVESAYPLDAQPSKIPIEITSVGGRQVKDFPVSLSSSELLGRKLIIEGKAGETEEIEKVIYQYNGGKWHQAKGKNDWYFVLPADDSRTFQLKILAWNSAGQISRPREFGPLDYQVNESVLPRNYERAKLDLNVESVAGYSYEKIETPFQLYRDDAGGGQITIAGTARAGTSVEGVAYSSDGGQSWKRATGNENWEFSLPVQTDEDFESVEILAWTVDGHVSKPLQLKHFNYNETRYTDRLRQLFRDQWTQITRENSRQFIQLLTSDFQFVDEFTGIQKDKRELRRLLDDLFAGSRNLNVDYNFKEIIANRSGGRIKLDLKISGVSDKYHRPFLIRGRNCEQQFRRNGEGEYEITSIENLPFVIYLFNRERMRIHDLKGFQVDTLQLPEKSEEADILAELTTPNFAVNTLNIGGDIKGGGLQELHTGGFEQIREIPGINGGYRKTQAISEGNYYAVNIRDNSTKQSTAIVKVTNIRPDYAEIKIISPRAAPGVPDRAYTRFRGVNPFD